jgi:hypothetical protein
VNFEDSTTFGDQRDRLDQRPLAQPTGQTRATGFRSRNAGAVSQMSTCHTIKAIRAADRPHSRGTFMLRHGEVRGRRPFRRRVTGLEHTL